jgi:hypothetical protein
MKGSPKTFLWATPGLVFHSNQNGRGMPLWLLTKGFLKDLPPLLANKIGNERDLNQLALIGFISGI